MKPVFNLIISLFICQTCLAQKFVYQDYTWDKTPVAYKPAANDTNTEVILFDKIAYQVSVENSSGYEYFLRHKATYVNSDQAVERNNKVYLPVNINSDFNKIHVRVMKSNGEIIEMNEKDIKEAVDEDSKRKYKYLAVRGLVPGSVVELISTYKSSSDFTGKRFVLQSEYPAKNCSFELIYPDHLVIDTKSFNGFPNLEKDTSYLADGLKCLKASASYIPALKSEKYSNRTEHIQAVAYKLTGNLNTRRLNINSYDKLADIFFNNMNLAPSKAELKSLEKFLAASGVNNLKNEEEKIRKLEDYVKKTIFHSDQIPAYSSTIDQLIEQKAGSEADITRLFVAAFNMLNIEHEILVTCNRYDAYFVKDYEGLNYLDNFFLYFPKYNKYLAPSFVLYRYGLMPYQYRNHYGLFVKKTSLGNLTTGLGEVRFIDTDTYLDNNDSIYVQVDFSKSMEMPEYKFRLTFAGHEASSVQSVFDFIKEEKQKDELRRELLKTFSDEAELENLKSENEGTAYFAKKPLILSASFKSGKYMDKAGSKYIFKIGDLIGPQEQMYQEEARKLPIEMNYCKNYFRTITFKIPAGYKLTNADKINMDVFHNDEKGNRDMAFKSWYVTKNDEITVYVEEYYKTINLPVSEYENFKNVINAAADFNKIALLFEPK
jgi:hypothetical protein